MDRIRRGAPRGLSSLPLQELPEDPHAEPSTWSPRVGSIKGSLQAAASPDHAPPPGETPCPIWYRRSDRGSFGWFDRGALDKRSARAVAGHWRSGAPESAGCGLSIAVRVADAVPLRTTRTNPNSTRIMGRGSRPQAPGPPSSPPRRGSRCRPDLGDRQGIGSRPCRRSGRWPGLLPPPHWPIPTRCRRDRRSGRGRCQPGSPLASTTTGPDGPRPRRGSWHGPPGSGS